MYGESLILPACLTFAPVFMVQQTYHRCVWAQHFILIIGYLISASRSTCLTARKWMKFFLMRTNLTMAFLPPVMHLVTVLILMKSSPKNILTNVLACLLTA